VQDAVGPPQRAQDLRDGLEVARDHAVVAHLPLSALLGDRDVDRFFVDIHADEHATFHHDLPPLCVALRDAFIGSA
jgi:hypothetical protein